MSTNFEVKCLKEDCTYVFKLTKKPTHSAKYKCRICKSTNTINKDLTSTVKVNHRRPSTPHWDSPRGFCRWCGKEIFKLNTTILDKRRNWHEECAHEYLIQTDNQYARKIVLKRDNGICKYCKKDTTKLLRWYYKLVSKINSYFHYILRTQDSKVAHKFKYKLETLMQKKYGSRYQVEKLAAWELDHETPLIDGGAHDLSNLIFLCYSCHKEKTRKENSERRKRKN